MKQLGKIKLYTLEEVSENLGLSKQILRDKLRRGIIKGQKNGNKWVVTEESLQNYLNGDPAPEIKYDCKKATDNRRERMAEVGRRKGDKKGQISTEAEGVPAVDLDKEPEDSTTPQTDSDTTPPASTLEPIHTPPDGEDTTLETSGEPSLRGEDL